MSKKTLKFGNTEVNKKKLHTSKQPIASLLVNVDQILMSEKFKHGDTGLEYFVDRYVLFYLK